MIDTDVRAFVDKTVDEIHPSIASLAPPAGYALVIETIRPMATFYRGHDPRHVLMIDLSWTPGSEGKSVRCGVVLTAGDVDRNPRRAQRVDLISAKLEAAGLLMQACYRRDIEGVPA